MAGHSPPVARATRKTALRLYTEWFTKQDDTARREIASINKPTGRYDRFRTENAEAMGLLEEGYGQDLRRDVGQAIGKYHAANPVRAVAAEHSAATASTGRAAPSPTGGDDQDMQIDNETESPTVAAAGHGVFTPAQHTAATTEGRSPREGCVLKCLNYMLRYYDSSGIPNSHPATREELNKHLAPLKAAAERNETLAQLFGEDNMLGDLQEDEAVVQQVRLLLRDRFGKGNYEFHATTPAEILRADQTGGRFLLVHGCLERAKDAVARWGHYDEALRADYKQIVTTNPEEYGDEFDKENMHVILIPPGKKGRLKRFYCHNLEPHWGTRGVTIKHLGLRDDGQPECRGYYMKYISRVYEICVTGPEESDSGDETYDSEAYGEDCEDPRLARENKRAEADRDTEASDFPLDNIVPGGTCTRQGTLFNQSENAETEESEESEESAAEEGFAEQREVIELLSDSEEESNESDHGTVIGESESGSESESEDAGPVVQKCYATVDGKRFDFHVRDGTKDLTVLYEHFSQDYLDQCDRFRWKKVKKYKGKTVPMKLKSYPYTMPSKYPGFDVKAGDICVDAGACIGAVAVRALAKGAAKVICIEPNPSNLTLLRLNLSQFPEHKYEIIEKAVTTASGEQVMLTDKFWRSSVDPDGTIPVTTIGLQELLDTYRPSMVKIDTEGSEIPTLMKRYNWHGTERLVFEYSIKENVITANRKPPILAIRDNLTADGFDCSGFLESKMQSVHDRRSLGSAVDPVFFCTRAGSVAPRVTDASQEEPTILERIHKELRDVTSCTDSRFADCKGFTLGLTCSRGPARTTKQTEKYPRLVKAIMEFRQKYVKKDLMVTSVYVTFNSQFKPHCDSSNAGDSAFVVIGDPQVDPEHGTSGDLRLFGEGTKVDGVEQKDKTLKALNTVQYFDGNVCHGTLPFKGERYSLVFYATANAYAPVKPNKNRKGIAPEVRAELRSLGFDVPGETMTRPVKKYFPSAKEDREEMGAARCEKYLKKCRKRVKQKRGAETEAGRASAKRSRH
jgi:FkbM family methyltransferase